MEKEKVRREIERHLENRVASDPRLHNVFLLVHSDRRDIHWPIAAGRTDGVPANPAQPYHTASIGKAFTSVLFAILAEKGLVKFDDPIADYLPPHILKDLHVFKGKDYTYDIQIKHLLSNTSGLPDYFEEKSKQGQAVFKEQLEHPSRLWTAEETILWSNEHLEPHFPPGKGVHYSDTGFNLLGLIIENITSKPYHEVLHEYLFSPLRMNHTYLCQYSDPAVKSELPTAKLYVDKLEVDVEKYRSFSGFYAGGQTVSTSEDLLIFIKALVNHQIVQKETLDAMQRWNRMRFGMDYGYGLMRMHFIPVTQKYIGWGHLGASGACMLYFPNLDVYMIGSFNQTAYRAKAMDYLFFKVLRKLVK
ncbi:serine hydrolase domain-containing protein [Paenibacillus azoreducens]|uniref:Serine-type D-Ala-D-Ala carboxypeptidase n=1 Tax=Paenibacillus azoreducens TaxID=116718 RepID=A0A919Y9Q0_9BACL|nr:serine hydrolase domain-containing protein [Paenibacillus azoreducens]GIO45758.1 serine-type D-Ala-D-Ala carboxypeptidase [Paenibacillus azoreducens]